MTDNLIGNQQIPDTNQITLTVGELRNLIAATPPNVDRLARAIYALQADTISMDTAISYAQEILAVYKELE